MDIPNSHPFPEYPSSNDDINFRGDISDPDSDLTESECEEEMESLWREFDEEKVELDKELEDEMQGQYGDPEEEPADDRLKEIWEESDETGGDETEESDESEDD